MLICDTGPLYAILDRRDPDHGRCLEALTGAVDRLLVPIPVVTEVCQLAESRQISRAVPPFLRGLAGGELQTISPAPEDWRRVAELCERYDDLPLGMVDACVVALAERLGATAVATLDLRHFSIVRPRHVERLTILPEP